MSLTTIRLPDIPTVCLFLNMALFRDVPHLVPNPDQPLVVVVDEDHENFKAFIKDYDARADALAESIKALLTHVLDQDREELRERNQADCSETKTKE